MLRRFVFAILISWIGLTAAYGRGGQIVGFSFDADDNLFNLPTKIMLFHKENGQEVGVTTAEFALIREQIGKPGGKWADFEMRYDRKAGSLRFFGDEIGDGVNYFLRDLKQAMSESENGWKALSFPAFVVAMEHEETARETTIITARGHKPETILAGLAHLRDLKIIKYLPLVENIWTVSNADFGKRFEGVFGIVAPEGSASSPSGRKAAVMEQVLDKIDRVALTQEAPLVLSPNGKESGRFHLWGFSDDDYGNFEGAVKTIQAGLDKGRWPKVKVTLFYTGPKSKAVVLQPLLKPRLVMPEETREWEEILKACSGQRRAALDSDLGQSSLEACLKQF